MKPQSKTNWERMKREAEADAEIKFDKETEPYDPNDAQAIEAFWQAATIHRPKRRGPQKSAIKVATAIRLDRDVVEAFKADGRGWQTRINDALKEWLKSHRAA